MVNVPSLIRFSNSVDLLLYYWPWYGLDSYHMFVCYVCVYITLSFVLWIIVCPFVPFLLAIVLSVCFLFVFFLILFMDSGYPFGILKLYILKFVLVIIIIIILYLPKAIQLIGIYTYNQYKNIFIAEHDN